MKHFVFFVLSCLAVIATGCSSNTYSSLRNQEDKLIANYISRNQLNILTEEPAEDYEWGEKDYYRVSGYDDLYFHLIKRGEHYRIDSISPTETNEVDQTILRNNVVVTRYKKFQLIEDADTLSYWTTLDQAYPYEFYYGITSGSSDGNTKICESIGWHEAVRLMKYPRAECEIIVPSKQGFSDDENTVTPYVYIIKIVQVRP